MLPGVVPRCAAVSRVLQRHNSGSGPQVGVGLLHGGSRGENQAELWEGTHDPCEALQVVLGAGQRTKGETGLWPEGMCELSRKGSAVAARRRPPLAAVFCDRMQ